MEFPLTLPSSFSPKPHHHHHNNHQRHNLPPPSALSSSPRSPDQSDSLRFPTSVRRPLAPPPSTPQFPFQTSGSFPPNPNHLHTTPLQKSPPNPLSSKLWLSTKLCPPPPPPLPIPLEEELLEKQPSLAVAADQNPTPAPAPAPNADDFRQKDKIFVGNLPLWIKKNEIAELFRQFGPVKNIVLIKGHDDPERNVGYCFVIFGGPTAEDSAAKAVEFDGIEFHGRVLTVRLDDGRKLKARSDERRRWVAGADGIDHRSRWHEERDGACRRFRKVLDTQPQNWQKVVSTFDKIAKEGRQTPCSCNL